MPGGSTKALDAWILETGPRAVAYARSLIPDRHAADDVVQDCFCRLLAKAADYDLPRDGTKLLFAAVTNACINWTQRRRPMLRLVDPDHEFPDTDPADQRTPAPESIVIHRELNDAVAAALAELPAPQRAAVELKSLGYSQPEIAEMLNVSPSNAGVLVHRGRQKLAELLAVFLREEAAS